MKRSLVFHLCSLLCSMLLVSNASCLSLQKLEKRDIHDGNGELEMDAPESQPGGMLLPTQSTILKDVTMPVTLPNAVPIVAEELQNSSGLLNTSTVNPNSEAKNLSFANEASPTTQVETSSENGILVTLGSSTNNTNSVASLNISALEPSQPADEMIVDQGNLENTSQVNTIEMLTTNPRTNIFETEEDQSTTSSPLTGQMITSVNTLTSEGPTDLETSTSNNQNNDDQVLENEGIEPAVFTIHPGVTVPSDDKSIFSTSEKIPEERFSSELTEPVVSPLMEAGTIFKDDLPTPILITTTDGDQAQNFSAVYSADVKQPDSDISEMRNVAVSPAIVMNVSSQETTRETDVIDETEETVREISTSQVLVSSNESTTGPPTTAPPLPAEIPSTEGSFYKDEDLLMGPVSPILPEAPTEPRTTTVTMITSAPQVNVMAPPTERITVTPAYGLERTESEEGDEEDEDEEDDDEADEDEEEEEEDDDKDNDSVDDSAEKDSDLSLFTLPGLSSQEPLEDDSNGALIDGVAYQVPDTIEWEQQNQGLVRSWMEKLKDKAGYMSGMLVPVGVGIAGALLILGALYSIKIMNRRRRNGFKRHKRKQREFNSMQDRVMLLADSSEDEF
uniref:Armadillo-like helical domain-containing protein 4 n=1 Tax=Pyxicephalus adspersus TaxID=30357 RepID=A0AAV2ZL62_PYXAD|nr:TPA: hypothetical protein GDO54_005342 [Pyxicephalus adspersus]